MSKKLCLFLFICLLGFQNGCRTEQAFVSVPDNNQIAETNDCADENKQTIETGVADNDSNQILENETPDEKIERLFVTSGLGEGDGFLEELMTFPKEKIIAVVQKLKETGISKHEYRYSDDTDEILKIKSAYFLWTLGVDTAANEKYIVDLTKTKSFKRNSALSYLECIISEGKKEYLPIIFEFAPEADGAYFTEVSGLFQYELENSPKTFLLYLSKMPFPIRKSAYRVVSVKGEVYDEEIFQKIKANVRKLKEDKEVKNTAAEFLREVDKWQRHFEREEQ
jgi:hypothetical protein